MRKVKFRPAKKTIQREFVRKLRVLLPFKKNNEEKHSRIPVDNAKRPDEALERMA